MARKYVTIGSLVNFHGYDNVDFDKAIATDGPISAGNPVDDIDVLRKEDMGSLVGIEGTVTGDLIRWNESADGWEVKHFPPEPATYTDNHIITIAELEMTHRMNSALDKIFTLPSVGADQDGYGVTLMNINSGKLTVQVSDNDIISDSSVAGSAYSTSALAVLVLEYVHSIVTWVIKTATGTWITT